MELKPVARVHTDFAGKFGIPRQSGLVPELTAVLEFKPEFRSPEAVRGLEAYTHLWLIWEFSANRTGGSLTVRPPRLGGNRRIGVFASRSPFRPNPLGLSCVKIDKVEDDQHLGPVIYVRGADLMDGTPVYDVKPYVAYADAHPEARSGFVDEKHWEPLHVEIPDKLAVKVPAQHLEALKATLAQDPRPAFHDDPERTYGMPYLNMDVRFRVKDGVLTVVDLAGAPKVASRLMHDDTVEAQQ